MAVLDTPLPICSVILVACSTAAMLTLIEVAVVVCVKLKIKSLNIAGDVGAIIKAVPDPAIVIVACAGVGPIKTLP